MARSDLHLLIDSLPEGALDAVRRMLEHFQTWPPQQPPEVERMRQIEEQQKERMRRRLMRPGMSGGGGGGSFSLATGYGHSSHTHWEEDTVVHDSCHLFKGHEIAVTERVGFANDGKAIRYACEVKGPSGGLDEAIFDL